MELSTVASQKLLSDLLIECSKWMYGAIYSENPSEDKGDEKKTKNKEVIRKQHDSGYAKWPKDIWILTGYFNTLPRPPTKDDTPKIKRSVEVQAGNRIFCMVASSHATKWEQARLAARGDKKSLSDIALSIQRVWEVGRLTVDGITQELEEIVTPEFEITVANDDPNFTPPRPHPSITYYRDLGIKAGEKSNMVAVALVKMLQFNKPGFHVVDFYAKSPGYEPTADINYEIDVRYYITVK
jgi:hypothetical protein